MKFVAAIVAASLASCAAATLLSGDAGREIVLGMIAPLAETAGTWVIVERGFRRNPAGVTSILMAAFAAKMIGFGVYVAAVLGVLGLRPLPFVVSFTGFFIGLHLAEALMLRRLVASAGQRQPQ